MNETMSEDALIESVNAMLDDFSHESTPLVRKIAAGTATREQITRLGIFFAYFTRVTPNELGHLISRCYDAAVRRDLVHILIDEDTGLRFEELSRDRFRCPACGATVREANLTDSAATTKGGSSSGRALQAPRSSGFCDGHESARTTTLGIAH